MKLVIDTTNKDAIKVKCDKLNPEELGLCLGKYIDVIADRIGADNDVLKLDIAQEITKAMFNCESAEVVDEKTDDFTE